MLEFRMTSSRELMLLAALLTGLTTQSVAVAGVLHVATADYSTIQSAVDAAKPGGKIVIALGEYNESIVVNVSSLRLVARDGLHTVVVDGTGLGSVDGIHVTANGVEPRDLVVRNFNTFVGPGVVAFRVGILVEESENCRIEGNLAHSNGDGNVLKHSSHCAVRGNESRNNIHNGIFLRNESNHKTVKDNVALDNGPDMNPAPDFVPAGVGCGIQLSFDANDNKIMADSLSGNGRGFQFDRGSTSNDAKKNVATNDSRFGIAPLAVGGQPAASGNSIKNNTALASGEFDLIDQGFPPAVGNTWENNEFETSHF